MNSREFLNWEKSFLQCLLQMPCKTESEKNARIRFFQEQESTFISEWIRRLKNYFFGQIREDSMSGMWITTVQTKEKADLDLHVIAEEYIEKYMRESASAKEKLASKLRTRFTELCRNKIPSVPELTDQQFEGILLRGIQECTEEGIIHAIVCQRLLEEENESQETAAERRRLYASERSKFTEDGIPNGFRIYLLNGWLVNAEKEFLEQLMLVNEKEWGWADEQNLKRGAKKLHLIVFFRNQMILTWAKAQPCYWLMFKRNMNVIETSAQKLLERRLKEGKEEMSLGQLYAKRQFLPDIYAQCFVSAIQDYKGINQKGERYSFRQSLGQKYNHAYSQFLTEKRQEEQNVVYENVTKKDLQKLIKAANDLARLKEKLGKEVDEATLRAYADGLLRDAKITFAEEKEKERLIDFVCATSMSSTRTVSLNENVYEDGEETLADTIESKSPGVEESAMKTFSEERNIQDDYHMLLSSWSGINNSLSLSIKEPVTAFLSRDIMKKLKWKNRKPYTQKPAGDKEVYKNLLPYEFELREEEAFNRQYLSLALMEFDSKHFDLYQVYVEFLKEKFDFDDDQIIGQAINKSDKEELKEYLKLYRKMMKKIMSFYESSNG